VSHEDVEDEGKGSNSPRRFRDDAHSEARIDDLNYVFLYV
jgi:hypothetical protein